MYGIFFRHRAGECGVFQGYRREVSPSREKINQKNGVAEKRNSVFDMLESKESGNDHRADDHRAEGDTIPAERLEIMFFDETG